MYHRRELKRKIRDVTLYNETLNKVPSLKLLGIIIDNKLTWQDHILWQNQWVTCIKLKKYVDMHTIINLHFRLIFPCLIYCNEIWGHVNNIYIYSLVKLQKKVIRIMIHSYCNAHTEPLFHQSVEYIRFPQIIQPKNSIDV